MPAAQFVHTLAPLAAANVPAGHGVHNDAAAAEKVPERQLMQAVEARMEPVTAPYLPAAQLVQAEEPVDAEKVPATHVEQAEAAGAE